MKSGSAAYSFPIKVELVELGPREYEGYCEEYEEEMHGWITHSLDLFTHIYGMVVDAHYISEGVSIGVDSTYSFVNTIVITGIVNNDSHFQEMAHDHWPSDLVEQLKEGEESCPMENIMRYNLNKINKGPQWTKFNSI